MPRPWDYGFQAWAYDPAMNAGNYTPGAGVLHLIRLYIRRNQAVYASKICTGLTTGGSGATQLANCYMGIYDSTGTLVANSGTADLSTPFATSGYKEADMGAAVFLRPGSNYWVGLVIGTQATTQAVFAHSAATSALFIAGLTNSNARGGTVLSNQSSLPGSFTPGNIALLNTFWAAVK